MNIMKTPTDIELGKLVSLLEFNSSEISRSE